MSMREQTMRRIGFCLSVVASIFLVGASHCGGSESPDPDAGSKSGSDAADASPGTPDTSEDPGDASDTTSPTDAVDGLAPVDSSETGEDGSAGDATSDDVSDAGKRTDGADHEDAGGDASWNCQWDETWSFSGDVQLHPVVDALDSDATLSGSSVWVAYLTNLRSPFSPGAAGDELDDCPNAVKTFDSSVSSASWSFEHVPTNGTDYITVTGHYPIDHNHETFVPTAAIAASEPNGDVTGAPAYTITSDSEAALAELVKGQIDAVDGPGDLVENGFGLIRYVDENGDPVEGVSVDASNALYFSSGYSEVLAGSDATTGPNGVALVWGNSQDEFTGTKSTDGGTVDFETVTVIDSRGRHAFAATSQKTTN